MLEHLFGSKTRVQLLRLLLNNPTQPFYLRELARQLKTQLNSIRREIANLEALGIVKAAPAVQIAADPGTKPPAKNTNKKHYLINTNFTLYPELKALVLKAHLLLEQNFVHEIEKLAKVKLFILTGIFVGLEGYPTDILLVGSINRERLTPMVARFQRELNREINYTVMSQQEFKYRQDITDRFLYDILEGKKMVIVNELL